jgi:hypothetical protein
VSFFEPVATPPPHFDGERPPLPWQEGLGKTVFSDVVLGEGPDGVLMLRHLVVFPKVMTLWVVALFRHPLVHGPGTRGHTSPSFGRWPGDDFVGTGIVMLGLRFNDETRYRNLDARGSPGRLASLRSGAGAFTGDAEFWAPLPPPGELEVWAAWPAARIAETRTLLDGSRIGDVARSLPPAWP